MTDNEVLEYIKKSFELKNQGFYKPAIEMLYKALTIENNNIEILSQLAELYYLLKNHERAINYIEKTLELQPLNIDCLKLKEKIYISQNNYVEAQRVALTIFDLSRTAENFAKRIELLNKLKDIETVKTLENYDIAFDAEICYQFAMAYYIQEDYNKAIEYLEKSKDMSLWDEKCEILLAEVYYLSSEFQKSK